MQIWSDGTMSKDDPEMRESHLMVLDQFDYITHIDQLFTFIICLVIEAVLSDDRGMIWWPSCIVVAGMELMFYVFTYSI